MSFTEALGGVGKFWEPLGSFGSVWEVLGGFERLWYASEGFGRFWKALEGFGRHGKGFVRLLDVLGCFGRLAAWLWSNGCFGKFWRLSESLRGMEGFWKIFGSFERLWEALM